MSPHFKNIYLPTTAALAYLTKTNSISTRIAKIISLESPLLSELLSVSQLFSSPDVTQTKKSLSGGFSFFQKSKKSNCPLTFFLFWLRFLTINFSRFLFLLVVEFRSSAFSQLCFDQNELIVAEPTQKNPILIWLHRFLS